jgi:hypothetical protein
MSSSAAARSSEKTMKIQTLPSMPHCRGRGRPPSGVAAKMHSPGLSTVLDWNLDGDAGPFSGMARKGEGSADIFHAFLHIQQPVSK